MDPEPMGRSYVKAPGWLALAVPALALSLLVWVELGGLDTSLFRFFNDLPRLTGPGFWAHITILGDGLVCAVLFLPWIRRHPERVWGGILGALAMVLILRLFKGIWGLPRPLAVLPPESVHVIGPGHRRGSFPSGHTSTFFLLVGIWALSTRNRVLSLLLVVPGILVGISRMAVGVHWPSDVLAGAALGWTTAWLGLRWAGRTPWGMGRTAQLIQGILLLLSALVLLMVDHTRYPGVLIFQRGIAALCLVVGGIEFRRLLRTPQESGFSSP
jgi:membrane-associated phospholipid phosphatase